MKRFLIPAVLFSVLFLVEMEANAQRGRIYRGRPVYRSRPMVSIGIGGVIGGFYGPGAWGYSRRPGMEVQVGVAVPPSGAQVRNLPPARRKVEINGIFYYEHNDVYLRERLDGGFEVVDAPIGAILRRLPPGAKLEKIDGKYYYQKNGVLYYRHQDDQGRTFYEVASRNGLSDTDDYYEEGRPDAAYDYDKNEHEILAEPGTKKERDKIMPESSSTEKGGTIRPQKGDRFEQLPRNSRQVDAKGTKLYVSPNGIYYKEVTENDQTVYEVVDGI